MRTIRDKQPKLLTALSDLTGRQVSNLSRSLRMMESHGLVALKKICVQSNQWHWQPVSRF
ncbi:HVO_A0114 family putative DNA-binding protein [Aeromonas veronii]|uniref:HVO_A0114 family putative DNA-binding protein n=1 Tax=Aeromonas veronii TaxID=654 RepID=UPI003F664E58